MLFIVFRIVVVFIFNCDREQKIIPPTYTVGKYGLFQPSWIFQFPTQNKKKLDLGLSYSTEQIIHSWRLPVHIRDSSSPWNSAVFQTPPPPQNFRADIDDNTKCNASAISTATVTKRGGIFEGSLKGRKVGGTGGLEFGFQHGCFVNTGWRLWLRYAGNEPQLFNFPVPENSYRRRRPTLPALVPSSAGTCWRCQEQQRTLPSFLPRL